MAKKSAKTAPVSTARVSDYAVLIRPIITEKTARVGSETNTVAFEVDPRCTKTDIRSAVERVFSVKVKAVRTSTRIGKMKRTAKSVGRRAGHKKAFVTLQDGHKIEVVEGL
jgi:large subunit ribosomal protein L23